MKHLFARVSIAAVILSATVLFHSNAIAIDVKLTDYLAYIEVVKQASTAFSNILTSAA